MKKMHLFGGGTVFHVRPHLALCAPAYGRTVHDIDGIMDGHRAQGNSELVRDIFTVKHLTKMAGGSLETNQDIAEKINQIIDDPESKFVIMAAALCDFEGSILTDPPDQHALPTPSGKSQPRLKSDQEWTISLTPAEKVISSIRKKRKDIFLVGFKTTAGATQDEQFTAGLGLLKGASCNLVLANDLHTRVNMVITPEQARYHVTTDRHEALAGLVEMALLRSKSKFTRSTVVPGEPVAWKSELIPNSLRTVVDHCIAKGAYKPFRGSTVGHFAAKLEDGKFLTSIRKSNFNKLSETGMVMVEAHDNDHVVAHGFKPSVGGQSQRIVFREHPDTDCIVHFHCPIKPGVTVPTRSQREFECGSHECGQNTSTGLVNFDGIHAVMLDKHGPNIVFNRNIDPERVISFIDKHFDLSADTSA